MIMVYIVQYRCNFTLTCKQFTHTHEQFSYRATHGVGFIPTRNSCKTIKQSLALYPRGTHARLLNNL